MTTSEARASLTLPGFGLRQAALVAGATAIYLALEWISYLHEYRGVPITAWNPGVGFLFGLIVAAGPRYAISLFAGVVIAEIFVLRTSVGWPILLGIAAIYASVFAFAAHLMRTRLMIDTGLQRLRDVLLLLSSGFITTLAVVILVCGLLLLDSEISWRDIPRAFVPFMVGDMIGIAVAAPLVLRLVTQRIEIDSELFAEFALYTALSLGALWIVAENGFPGGLKYFYLLLIPVLTASIRHGLDGACAALAIAQVGLVAVSQYYGADDRSFTEMQLLMLALTTAGLIVGVTVSERENALHDAEEARRLLKEKQDEAAQAARFNLVSGMATVLAHEINQPMTATRALVRSAQELLRGQKTDIPRADANLANAIAQVDHASSIVKRMRDFLRRGSPRLSTLEPKEMLEDAIALARTAATTRGVGLRLGDADNLPLVHGDRVQLQQVLLNLVQNAIDAVADAKPENGTITLSAYTFDDPSRVEFAIADNGPGIKTDILDRLFEPMVTSKREGLGLGLAICALIVEAHGGKIWVASREQGATEFRFSLPAGS
ncbi:MAG: MASE1 domain-containing protein [Xanthobacteraceae bacterium]|nr:MASE1 domain-containing protein [Xanthobacteraceae bacterium]QYK45739.1 MAG: MASE1 domain-containing protein [Xanthobacteraceae bacterium]